ncbi:hypothetical protein N7462_001811 [Penicillium macrosclerotiorum]|uniref:uncharacterized protein n=1 Tax=Penicillium macrosclerotiorum TaxID=303699 RepID=UPI002547132E|nr:uncharacterized protein N7462_001811 [Penicillium macrosclerotiorum]KAJ5692388.1 hypothetical protein N7462_001811 [Penicillium macrosclerotiorum]
MITNEGSLLKRAIEISELREIWRNSKVATNSMHLTPTIDPRTLTSNCEIATPSLQPETLSYPTPKSPLSPSSEDDDLDPGIYASYTKPEDFHASVGSVATSSDEAQAIHNSKPEHLNHMGGVPPYFATVRMDAPDI